MDDKLNVSFSDYIKEKRLARGKSLRETAKAMDISPQFYSEVEKGRRKAFTVDRLVRYSNYLVLNEIETKELYDKAAQSRTSSEVAVQQDIADYVVENQFVIEALRLAKETGAGEKEWAKLLAELKERKG